MSHAAAAAKDQIFMAAVAENMAPMVARIEQRYPQSGERFAALDQWMARHGADLLVDDPAQPFPVTPGIDLLKRLPGAGEPLFEMAATAYAGALFDMALGEPDALAGNHLALFRISLG